MLRYLLLALALTGFTLGCSSTLPQADRLAILQAEERVFERNIANREEHLRQCQDALEQANAGLLVLSRGDSKEERKARAMAEDMASKLEDMIESDSQYLVRARASLEEIRGDLRGVIREGR